MNWHCPQETVLAMFLIPITKSLRLFYRAVEQQTKENMDLEGAAKGSMDVTMNDQAWGKSPALNTFLTPKDG